MAAVWKQQPDEILKDWLFQAMYKSTDLTDWERNFLVSIDKQYRKTGKLSKKQQDILERIYAEKTR